jgi:lysophospholipase L1-like esterase
VRARAGLDTLRVLQFGDSHSAARSFVATWRAYLQAQFGDGGYAGGLPWLAAAGPRCGKSPGWKVFQPTLRNGTDGRSGPGGAYLEAQRSGERAWVETRFRRLRIHLLRHPGGGQARIRVDGREVALANLDGTPEALCLEPELLGEGRRLEIESLGGPVRILGVALENGPGASFAALGANGAQASWLLRSDSAVFESVLRRESPDLVLLAFGTNEASLRDFEPLAYQRSLRTLLERFQAAAPAVGILLLGPPDALLPRARPGALAEVARIQMELARQTGSLFISQQEAMGGEGAIFLWARDGLALKDHVHFSAEGYARLARLGLAGLFGRLERTQPTLESGGDPRLLKARAGAFELPAQAPRLLGRFENRTPETAPVPRPIYTFRHEDGRLFITDDPAKVEGMKGSWVGRGPQ